MKTIPFLTTILAGAALSAAPLRADEPAKQPAKDAPAKEMKCCAKKEDGVKKEDSAKKGGMEAKMQAMEARMKAEEAQKKADAAELDRLFDAMNSSIGEKKVEAMAAILNKMAQQQKAMKAKCEAMMKGMMKDGGMKKDGAPATPAAKAGELDYYTCTMHPVVHWPVPGKCPICEMALVPVFKKAPGAAAAAKPEAKPGEDPKKPADPHAAHH
jgi:hypothetical protein